MSHKVYKNFYEAFACEDRRKNLKLSLMSLGSIAIKKTKIMKKEEIENLSLLEYILYIDSLGTKEFCDWQGIKSPYWTGNVEQSSDMFLQIDVVKLRLIKEKAKSVRDAERRKVAMDWWNGLIMLDKARFSIIDRDFRTLTGREIELIYNQHKELDKNKNK